MAQFDNESVVVYQAYRPEIGQFAATHGYFGGAFSLARMSSNFLWMMCGWASKEGQDVLAVTIERRAFDEILAAAVPSSYGQVDRFTSTEAWSQAVKTSDVRLQWDHGPSGAPLEWRAIQLGLRGEVLAHYARPWIRSIEDISEFVRAQAKQRATGDLVTPREEVYPVAPETAAIHGL